MGALGLWVSCREGRDGRRALVLWRGLFSFGAAAVSSVVWAVLDPASALLLIFLFLPSLLHVVPQSARVTVPVFFNGSIFTVLRWFSSWWCISPPF